MTETRKQVERELVKIKTAYAVGRSEGERAAEKRVLKLAEDVAKEVGGKYWETHRLNVGLQKFIARLLDAFPELARGEEPSK